MKEEEIVLKEIVKAVKSIKINKTIRLIDEIIKAKKIDVIGHGRSGYIASCFLMRLKHLGLKVSKSIDRGDLTIIISGSGETRKTLKKINNRKGLIILLSMNKKSLIGEKADVVIDIKAKRSKQPLRSLFEQSCLIYLDSVVMELMKKMNVNEKEMWKRHD